MANVGVVFGGRSVEHQVSVNSARTVARGFRLYAGHGLTAANVGPIAALPGMEELNIGHSLVARSVALGLPGAVREMLAAMRAAR